MGLHGVTLGAAAVGAAEEGGRALVEKHQLTPQGQAALFCQPAEQLREDSVDFSVAF